MSNTVLLMVTAVVLLLFGGPAAAFFPGFRPFGQVNHGMRVARCPAASKPCRIKAVLEREGMQAEEINTEPCSCPDSKTCSSDWRANRGRVLTRELITDGNIRITLMMMFCDAIRPQEVCQPGQVAVRLTGLSMLPMEVESINCSCADPRPLVIHEKSTNQNHLNVHSYVCSIDKRRCNTRWWNRDTCLVTDLETHTLSYPCKCPRGTACRSPYETRRNAYTCASTNTRRG